MSNSTHMRYEFLRTLRNPLTLGFTLGLPLVVFLAIAGTNRHGTLQGISVTVYFMGAMAAYGAMLAAVQPGARIALDRSKGWTRQLRITPLRSDVYFVAKILAAYLVVLVILSALFLAGTALGAHMAGVRWLELAALLLVGLAPFVVLGIALGHLLRPDSLSAVVGGTRGDPRHARRSVRTGVHKRHDAQPREAVAVLLAGPGKPGERRWRRMAGRSLDGCPQLDGGDNPARAGCIPP